MGDEDVELGALSGAETGRRGDVDAGIADRRRHLGQRPRRVLDVDDQVVCHVGPARGARWPLTGASLLSGGRLVGRIERVTLTFLVTLALAGSFP